MSDDDIFPPRARLLWESLTSDWERNKEPWAGLDTSRQIEIDNAAERFIAVAGLVPGHDYQGWEQATDPIPKTWTDEDRRHAEGMYAQAVYKVNQEVFLRHAAKAGLVPLAEVRAIVTTLWEDSILGDDYDDFSWGWREACHAMSSVLRKRFGEAATNE